MSTNIGSFKLIAKRRSFNNIKLVCVSICATEGIFLELEHYSDNGWSDFSGW